MYLHWKSFHGTQLDQAWKKERKKYIHSLVSIMSSDYMVMLEEPVEHKQTQYCLS